MVEGMIEGNMLGNAEVRYPEIRRRDMFPNISLKSILFARCKRSPTYGCRGFSCQENRSVRAMVSLSSVY
jgi:hypothetical protein